MNSQWKACLQASGAIFNEDGNLTGFEQTATSNMTNPEGILCDLSHLALISVTGEDSESFLQGQLTNDVQQVSTQHSQLAAWCNPKGRVQTHFRVFQCDANYYLACPQERLEFTLKRLQMYVLRAQVKLQAANETLSGLGLGGAQADKLLQQVIGTEPPTAPDQVLTTDKFTIICIAGIEPRYMVFATTADLIPLWQDLSVLENVLLSGADAWELQDIQAGLPQVFTDTAGAFLPQMLNLQVLNGVSFKKGCYTGQEVVARTQFLGKVKRHMFIAKTASQVFNAGTELYIDGDKQSVGKIVNMRPQTEDTCLCLVVLKIQSTEHPIHIGNHEGPVLELQTLPYSLE